jgi:hypothetical protein
MSDLTKNGDLGRCLVRDLAKKGDLGLPRCAIWPKTQTSVTLDGWITGSR